jgi:hypothetical protein
MPSLRAFICVLAIVAIAHAAYPLYTTCPAPASIGGAQATIGGKAYSGAKR